LKSGNKEKLRGKGRRSIISSPALSS